MFITKTWFIFFFNKILLFNNNIATYNLLTVREPKINYEQSSSIFWTPLQMMVFKKKKKVICPINSNKHTLQLIIFYSMAQLKLCIS